MHKHNHNKSKCLSKASNDTNFYEDELKYANIVSSNAACEIMKLRCMMHYNQRRDVLNKLSIF